MTNVEFYILICERRRTRSAYGFFYRPTSKRPYPSIRRVAKKLGVDYRRKAGERLTLYPIGPDPPDRVLSAAAVGTGRRVFEL